MAIRQKERLIDKTTQRKSRLHCFMQPLCYGGRQLSVCDEKERPSYMRVTFAEVVEMS